MNLFFHLLSALEGSAPIFISLLESFLSSSASSRSTSTFSLLHKCYIRWLTSCFAPGVYLLGQIFALGFLAGSRGRCVSAHHCMLFGRISTATLPPMRRTCSRLSQKGCGLPCSGQCRKAGTRICSWGRDLLSLGVLATTQLYWNGQTRLRNAVRSSPRNLKRLRWRLPDHKEVCKLKRGPVRLPNEGGFFL